MCMHRHIVILVFSAAVATTGTSPEMGRTVEGEPVNTVATKAERLVFVQIPARTAEEGLPKGQAPSLALWALRRGDVPAGSRIVAFDPAQSTDGVINLTPQFVAAGRCDLSFDGQRVLFVGKRQAADSFSVWEMGVDGGDLREVINHPGDCSSAIYLSTLYTMGAEQPVYQIAFCSLAPDSGVASVYTCRLDGTHVRRITFAPDGVFDPYLLSDGRLLFSSWRRSKQGMEGRRNERTGARKDSRTSGLHSYNGAGAAMFTVNTDGTDLFIFAATREQDPSLALGARGAATVRSMPCETPDGWVVYVESDLCEKAGSCGWDRGGSLVAVSRTRSLHTRRVVTKPTDSNPWASSRKKGTKGRRDEGTKGKKGTKGRRDEGTEGNPQSAIRNPQSRVPNRQSSIVNRQSPIRNPQSRSGLYHSPSVLDDGRLIVSYRPRDGGTYGLYVLDLSRPAGLVTVFDAPEWHDVHALAVHPRPIPAGRSSVVDERVDTGLLYCLDAYLSGTGRIRVGGNETIDRLRVIGAEEKVLGEVAVEADGSFCLEVPARTPLRLQTLTATGQVVQDMRSWMWVMPKEARGCIGCHEDRELTPPNRFTRALQKRPRTLDAAGSGADSPTQHGHHHSTGHPE